MSSQEMTEAEGDNEELDPRVQEELEKLNNCTDEINRSVSQAISNSEIFYFVDLKYNLMTQTQCSASSCLTPLTTSRVCPRSLAIALRRQGHTMSPWTR